METIKHMSHGNIEIFALGAAVVLAIGIGLFVLMRQPKQRKIKATLASKDNISHDTVLFTFVPKGVNSLGLKIGEHIEIEAEIDGKVEKRKYTPVSRADRKGSFELLIKVYHKCEKFPRGGLMSQYLNELNIDSEISLTLPFGKLNYNGSKVVALKRPNNSVNYRKYETLYMVGGGTGITPLYQIIQYISETEKDNNRPNIILLFANRSEQDILLRKQLLDFSTTNDRFKVYFSVDRSENERWEGFVGFLNDEKISKTMPGEGDLSTTLFMSCGPPIMCNIVEKIFLDKKIPVNQIHRF